MCCDWPRFIIKTAIDWQVFFLLYSSKVKKYCMKRRLAGVFPFHHSRAVIGRRFSISSFSCCDWSAFFHFMALVLWLVGIVASDISGQRAAWSCRGFGWCSLFSLFLSHTILYIYNIQYNHNITYYVFIYVQYSITTIHNLDQAGGPPFLHSHFVI